MRVMALNESTQARQFLEPYLDLVNPALGPVYGIIGHNNHDDSGLGGWISLLTSLPLDQIVEFITMTNGLDFPPEQSPKRKTIVPAGGKGNDLTAAIGGGIGEFVERYLAALAFFYDYAAGKILYASAHELRRKDYRHLGPEDIPLFAPSQYAEPNFPFQPFTASSRIGWVRAATLGGEEIFVPAALVYMAYKSHKDETIIAYPTSGGLSYRASRQEAILHGIMELIERDAVNLFWISRVPSTRILAGLEELGFQGRFIQPDKLYLLKMTTDAPDVCTIHAMYFDHRRPLFLGGGASDADLLTAVQKACLEVKQTAYSARFVEASKNISKEELVDFFYVIPYYSHPKRIGDLEKTINTLVKDHLPLGNGEVPRAARLTVDYLVRHLGTEPVVYDFDLAALGVPHGSLTRILIPSLTMPGVPRWPFLGHSRYYSAPHVWGITPRPLHLKDLNLDPLPFP